MHVETAIVDRLAEGIEQDTFHTDFMNLSLSTVGWLGVHFISMASSFEIIKNS